MVHRPLWFAPLQPAALPGRCDSESSCSSTSLSSDEGNDDGEGDAAVYEPAQGVPTPPATTPLARSPLARARARASVAKEVGTCWKERLEAARERISQLEQTVARRPKLEAEGKWLKDELQRERLQRRKVERDLQRELAQMDAEVAASKARLSQGKRGTGREKPLPQRDRCPSARHTLREAFASLNQREKPLPHQKLREAFASLKAVTTERADVPPDVSGTDLEEFDSAETAAAQDVAATAEDVWHASAEAWSGNFTKDTHCLREALCDSLDGVSREAQNLWTCRYQKVSAHSTIPELARHLAGVVLAGQVECASFETRMRNKNMEYERQCMALADVESHALSVLGIVEEKWNTNQDIFATCKKLKETIPELRRHKQRVDGQKKEETPTVTARSKFASNPAKKLAAPRSQHEEMLSPVTESTKKTTKKKKRPRSNTQRFGSQRNAAIHTSDSESSEGKGSSPPSRRGSKQGTYNDESGLPLHTSGEDNKEKTSMIDSQMSEVSPRRRAMLNKKTGTLNKSAIHRGSPMSPQTSPEALETPTPAMSRQTSPEALLATSHDLHIRGTDSQPASPRSGMQVRRLQWRTMNTLLLHRESVKLDSKRDRQTSAMDEDAQHWLQMYSAADVICHEFVPELRTLSELHRQYCERWQEAVDLRARVAAVHNPFSLYLERRFQLAESRLQRLQRMRERLAGTALAELETVRRWLAEIAHPFAPSPWTSDVSSAILAPEKLLETYGVVNPVCRSTVPVVTQQMLYGMSQLGPTKGPPGARALWSLAGSLWALSAYARTELAMVPPTSIRGPAPVLYFERTFARAAFGPDRDPLHLPQSAPPAEDEDLKASKVPFVPKPPPYAIDDVPASVHEETRGPTPCTSAAEAA